MADAQGRLGQTFVKGVVAWAAFSALIAAVWVFAIEPLDPFLTQTAYLVIPSVFEFFELWLIVWIVGQVGLSAPLLAARPWANRFLPLAIMGGALSVLLAYILPFPDVVGSDPITTAVETVVDAGADRDIYFETPITSDFDRWAVTLLWLVCGCLITPIVEEVIYRGWLQSAMIDSFAGPHLAIAISSIVFGLAHPDFLGATASGLIFGYLRHLSGNLAAPIIAHALHNLAVGVVVFASGGASSMLSLI